jgi:hypothetical protein
VSDTLDFDAKGSDAPVLHLPRRQTLPCSRLVQEEFTIRRVMDEVTGSVCGPRPILLHPGWELRVGVWRTFGNASLSHILRLTKLYELIQS